MLDTGIVSDEILEATVENLGAIFQFRGVFKRVHEQCLPILEAGIILRSGLV